MRLNEPLMQRSADSLDRLRLGLGYVRGGKYGRRKQDNQEHRKDRKNSGGAGAPAGFRICEFIAQWTRFPFLR
jgi:hypothetical protein